MLCSVVQKRCFVKVTEISESAKREQPTKKTRPTSRAFFEKLKPLLGIKQASDWHSVSYKTVVSHGGYAHLRRFGHCPALAISASYPEHKWQLWMFDSVPKGFWKVEENRRQFFEAAKAKLGVSQLDDWYKIKANALYELKGEGLLREYHWNLAAAVSASYPEHKWHLWKFESVPRGYWASLDHRREVVEYVAAQLGFKSFEEWYKLSFAHFSSAGVASKMIGHIYKGSIALAVMELFPDHAWQPWRFFTPPPRVWDSKQTRLEFFDWASVQLNLSNLDGWYSVTRKDLTQIGGAMLLTQYRNSIEAALRDIYPNHSWQTLRFTAQPNATKRTAEELHDYMESLKASLHIRSLDDWYHVSNAQLREARAQHQVKKYGGLFHVLSTAYPQHHWETSRFHMTNTNQVTLLQ